MADAMELKRYLRARDIYQQLGISKTTFYRFVNKGILPPGIRLGPGTTTIWDEDEIIERMEAYRSGLK